MDKSPVSTAEPSAKDASVKLESAALARILQEVRHDVVSAPTAYNRMHNRHNR